MKIESLNINDSKTFKIDYTIQEEDAGMELEEVITASSNSFSTESKSKKFKVEELVSIPKTQAEFAKLSWEEINILGNIVKENPDEYQYMIGWTKDIVFDSPINKTITHKIVDICHTDYGTNHAFIFMPERYILNNAKYTSSTISNQKYVDSLIDKNLQPGGEYWSSLPADLVTVMKDCNIKYFTSIGTSSWSATSTAIITRKWFLPAIVEVGLVDSASTSYNNEGTIFASFASTSNDNRIRWTRLDANSSTTTSWWLRSLNRWSSGSTFFSYVKNDGSLYYNYSITDCGLCPCFAV